jgi:hypothetical protein
MFEFLIVLGLFYVLIVALSFALDFDNRRNK